MNELIKQYGEVRKTTIEQGDGYTTLCLLDYANFKDKYKLIAVDLSKQKALNADSRAIQQLSFEGIARQNLRLCTVLEFYKGTAKVL